mmetsp:Transcript_75550/g.120155  ORF Transcript_75550/g.120155 Transcript_75550/m.120155 type:complete len:204 (-) Transcript_75550:1049-1660(-)
MATASQRQIVPSVRARKTRERSATNGRSRGERRRRRRTKRTSSKYRHKRQQTESPADIAAIIIARSSGINRDQVCIQAARVCGLCASVCKVFVSKMPGTVQRQISIQDAFVMGASTSDCLQNRVHRHFGMEDVEPFRAGQAIEICVSICWMLARRQQFAGDRRPYLAASRYYRSDKAERSGVVEQEQESIGCVQEEEKTERQQ